MKNIAKCNLCKSVIESITNIDYVSCKCGEISVGGGEALYCSALHWENFMRVDDEGNEIVVSIVDAETKEPSELTRKDLIKMLGEMVKSVEALPQIAMSSPISHYDFLSLLLLLNEIFTSENG